MASASAGQLCDPMQAPGQLAVVAFHRCNARLRCRKLALKRSDAARLVGRNDRYRRFRFGGG